MSPAPIPRDLLAAIASAGNDLERAADFIEEYICFRRSKGDTLYGVSNSLVELEKKLPARSAPAIRQAQYATNVPPPSDLTPPSDPSHQLASSPQTVLNYLTSEPTPNVQHARQVILEYVLSRETRIRDKKPGRGGKGTLGRDGFEDIAARLGEIEDGLRGKGPLVATRRGPQAPAPSNIPDDELPQSRQLGLALVLSLRMLLSYFTLVDLGRQLLSQTPQDAVRTLVQHIRRRVPGEGRFTVGRELEYVESLTLPRRPALRPAFRSALERTHLPPRAIYPITLPAPSKSACLKLLSAFIRDVDQGGPAAATAYMQAGNQPPTKGKKTSPLMGSGMLGSPITPVSSSSSPTSTKQHPPLPTDPTPIENYTVELLSEWLTREKREYMAKNKWAKMGREQLSKDLCDIEAAICVVGKDTPSAHCGSLMPVFLLLRRTFSLTHTHLPNSVIGSAYEMLPMPPVPDGVPLAEPTVSSTTAALYVNPRLSDAAALDAIEELLESEREKGINAAVSEEKTVSWLLGLVDQIQKRFPDGSYETVFEQARAIASFPRAVHDEFNSAFPSHPLAVAAHRRSKSSSVTSPTSEEFSVPSPHGAPTSSGKSHSRSASMPLRTSDLSQISAPMSGEGMPMSHGHGSPTAQDTQSSHNHGDTDSETSHATSHTASHWRGPIPPPKDGTQAGSAATSPVSADSKAKRDNRDRSNSKASNQEKWHNLLGAVRSKAPPPMLNVEVPFHSISTELSDFMEQPSAQKQKRSKEKPPAQQKRTKEPTRVGPAEETTPKKSSAEENPSSEQQRPTEQKRSLAIRPPTEQLRSVGEPSHSDQRPSMDQTTIEPPLHTPVSVSSAAGSSENGWWDMVSDMEPGETPDRELAELPLSTAASAVSTTIPATLPPGAETPVVNGAAFVTSPDVATPTMSTAATPKVNPDIPDVFPVIPGWTPRPGNVPLQLVCPPQPGNPGLVLRRFADTPGAKQPLPSHLFAPPPQPGNPGITGAGLGQRKLPDMTPVDQLKQSNPSAPATPASATPTSSLGQSSAFKKLPDMTPVAPPNESPAPATNPTVCVSDPVSDENTPKPDQPAHMSTPTIDQASHLPTPVSPSQPSVASVTTGLSGLGLGIGTLDDRSPDSTITRRTPKPLTPLTAEEVEHAAAAAAAHAATEAKLARNGNSSNPSSAGSTPHATPTMASAPRVEAYAPPRPPRPPRPSRPHPTEQLSEFGAAPIAGPTSAPVTTGSRQWPQQIETEKHQHYRGHGTLPKSTSAIRPPPVPITIDRPGFPSRSAPVDQPKSKFGSFGRSMSLGARQVMGRTKDKDKHTEKGTVSNNPERWNRDMVVGIMGPPVERR